MLATNQLEKNKKKGAMNNCKVRFRAVYKKMKISWDGIKCDMDVN